MQEVAFSEFLQRPTETIDKLTSSPRQALRIENGGGEDDFVLTTVSRAAQGDRLVKIAGDFLRAILSDPVLRSSQLVDLLPQVFPWVRYLPDGDQREFARELAAGWDASEDVGSPAFVLQLITEWSNTAHIYTDPELLMALSSPMDEQA
ncbi:hypothetical protein G3I17_24420 [Streptomyces sp. SID13031]|nr:hypothetical protein [Streptomyces sp. SID13031]